MRHHTINIILLTAICFISMTMLFIIMAEMAR